MNMDGSARDIIFLVGGAPDSCGAFQKLSNRAFVILQSTGT
jgi:hypothetical protein